MKISKQHESFLRAVLMKFTQFSNYEFLFSLLRESFVFFNDILMHDHLRECLN